MSRDTNQVFLIGRLTANGVARMAGSANLVAFSLAVGDSKEETSFFDCQLWGKTAAAVGRFLVKGKQVAVIGRLRQERWEKDGAKRSKIVVNCNDVQLLGGKAPAAGEAVEPVAEKKVTAEDVAKALGAKADEVPF